MGILQTNAWPEKPDETNCIPCDEMVECIKAFEVFYNSKHSGRKLQWMYTMGSVELTTKCFPKKHVVVVSAYQCLALMLFNKRKEVSFKEICDATKVPKEECKRQVLSMTAAKHRLLLRVGDASSSKDLEDDTVLTVNESFTNEKMKVQV